jgi:acyl-CoA synthetase (AMP-forming)/AMP-acid ligase II
VPDVQAGSWTSGKGARPNEKGEILFNGPNIMTGYYRHEKETREINRDGWLIYAIWVTWTRTDISTSRDTKRK